MSHWRRPQLLRRGGVQLPDARRGLQVRGVRRARPAARAAGDAARPRRVEVARRKRSGAPRPRSPTIPAATEGEAPGAPSPCAPRASAGRILGAAPRRTRRQMVASRRTVAYPDRESLPHRVRAAERRAARRGRPGTLSARAARPARASTPPDPARSPSRRASSAGPPRSSAARTFERSCSTVAAPRRTTSAHGRASAAAMATASAEARRSRARSASGPAAPHVAARGEPPVRERLLHDHRPAAGVGLAQRLLARALEHVPGGLHAREERRARRAGSRARAAPSPAGAGRSP